jgi:peptidoglycan/xylan/chitin deacetylase (PgdA/CDA1 family)
VDLEHAVRVRSFEEKLTALKEQGFTTIFWGDLYEYMAGSRPLPRDSILITFDDGYLDWCWLTPS